MSRKSCLYYPNPNPRIGVLLRNANASVRLYNTLNPKFGKRGLNWFQKNWPEDRRRKELRGWGEKTSDEWHKILWERDIDAICAAGRSGNLIVEDCDGDEY